MANSDGLPFVSNIQVFDGKKKTSHVRVLPSNLVFNIINGNSLLSNNLQIETNGKNKANENKIIPSKW